MGWLTGRSNLRTVQSAEAIIPRPTSLLQWNYVLVTDELLRSDPRIRIALIDLECQIYSTDNTVDIIFRRGLEAG
jgi:hypothetical protein